MAEALKDSFDRRYVEIVADVGAAAWRDFDAKGFVTGVSDDLPKLELKDRINLIADEVRIRLPDAFPDALERVVMMAETISSPSIADEAAWGSGWAWPMCSIVERHGIDHPDESLAAMEELTKAFSCEFAIRPFLDQHLERTIDKCREWLGHSHPAVRRLPSEGTRPYLPWGTRIKALLEDPGIGISLVTELRHDPNEVVRRSVANHLNDIARAHPDRVAAIAADWLAEPPTDAAMVRHALRGLVKKGHAGAMAALGFTTEAAVNITRFTVEPAEIHLGDTIKLAATIESSANHDQRLVVDFVVHHVGARGETSPKVFKWTTVDLGVGERIEIEKRRLIKTASTRRYYQGVHRVELNVAGETVAESSFDLLDSSD